MYINPHISYQHPIEPLEPRTLLSTASFLSPVNTAFPAAAVTTVEGSLNGSGIPSIVAGYANGSAQAFSGSSNGTLVGGQVLQTGGAVLALGHFTASGHLDLATADGVFEGNGDGTFSSTPVAAINLPADTVALYAVNTTSSGSTDLVVGIFTPASGNTPASVSIAVMLGNGSGTFGAPIVTPVGSAAGITSDYASDFVFGDFTDNSGPLDVVTPFGLMVGTGAGSFAAPNPLPGSSSSLPTGPVLASLGDNGNLDLAVEPPDATAGTGNGDIEILDNNGAGTFTIGQTIDLAADGGVSTLTAADVNNDGTADLIAGVGDTSGSPAVAVMLNNGVGTFQNPTLFNTPGVPVTLYSGDFSGDGESDLLAIDASSNVFPGTAPTTGASAGVLLNNATIPLSAAVTLTTTANPSVRGIPVEFKAMVAGPVSAGAPTGTVTFFSNGVSIGTGAISSSIATFSTAGLAAGQDNITAQYSGDAHYDAATSSALVERVLQTSAKTPLVVPSIATLTAPAVTIAGDKAIVAFTINNEGGGSANGKISAAFYVSSSGTVDSSAILVKNFAVHLGIGGASTGNVKLKLPALAAGTYSVLVQLTAVSGLTSDQVATTVAASPTTFQSLGYAFGAVGAHKNVKTTLTDALGNSATLSLSGPGTGVATTVNNQTTITVTGTSAASAITIVSRIGSFAFNTLTVSGPLKSLAAKSVVDAGTLTIGSGQSVAIALAAGSSGTIDSAAPISTLTVGNFMGGKIVAPSIGTLNVTGSISGDVFTHGGGITSTRIGSIVGGAWAIAGNIGTLKLLDNLSSAQILAGADAGADNTLATSDDVYSAATINEISIAGSDSASVIGAGAVPGAAGAFQLLPNSALHGIVVKGAVSTDSRFLAFHLPPTAILGGASVTTSTDPHFEV